MPCFLQALKSIVDNLGLTEPLAPSPLPYAIIAAMFPSPSPLPPTYTEQILTFLRDSTKSGPLPAALTLTGALLMILPLVEAILSHEEDVRLQVDELPQHQCSARATAAEPTSAYHSSQPMKRLEIEAHIEEMSEDISTSDDTLEREPHDELCSEAYASLIEEMEATIERDLMERMKKEGRTEKDVVERMEMDAKIENDAFYKPSSSRPSQMDQRAKRSRRRNEPESEAEQPRDIPSVMDISDYSVISDLMDMSDITVTSYDMDVGNILEIPNISDLVPRV